jgi:hypothetical protein
MYNRIQPQHNKNTARTTAQDNTGDSRIHSSQRAKTCTAGYSLEHDTEHNKAHSMNKYSTNRNIAQHGTATNTITAQHG